MRTVCRVNVRLSFKICAYLDYLKVISITLSSRTLKLLRDLKDFNFVFIRDLQAILHLPIGCVS